MLMHIIFIPLLLKGAGDIFKAFKLPIQGDFVKIYENQRPCSFAAILRILFFTLFQLNWIIWPGQYNSWYQHQRVMHRPMSLASGSVTLSQRRSPRKRMGVFWSGSPTGVKVLRIKFWPIPFINTIWLIVYPKQYLCSWLRLGQEIYLLRLTYGFSSGESHTAGRVRKCQARRRSFKLGSFLGPACRKQFGSFQYAPHQNKIV